MFPIWRKSSPPSPFGPGQRGRCGHGWSRLATNGCGHPSPGCRADSGCSACRRCAQTTLLHDLFLLATRLSGPSVQGWRNLPDILVVEARLKGRGMHRERHNVKPMLALRHAVYNEQWQDTWRLACHQRRDARSPCRRARAKPRHPARPETIKPEPISPPDPPALLAMTSRPFPHHRLPTWLCLCSQSVCNKVSRTPAGNVFLISFAFCSILQHSISSSCHTI